MSTNPPASLPTIVNHALGSTTNDAVQQLPDQGLPLPFIAGRFKATRNYSAGGMSRTYLGFQLNIEYENKVVIKIPNISYPESVKLFESECSLLESLDNAYIAKCLECGSLNVNGTAYPYMVMGFIDGQTVEQRTQVKGKMEWQEVKELLMDMCQALKYLHEKNICHRDIKPANIIYDTQNKRWMLVDFGIAKDFSRGNMPTILSNAGTWDYMAPEQLYKGESGDVRSDIYSLGMVAWQALTGEVPRPGTKYPHEAGIDSVSVDVDKLISTMVHQEPAKRYQSPMDLERAVKVGARRVENWQQAKKKMCKVWKWTKRVVISAAILIASWWIGNCVAAAYIKNAVEEMEELNQISAALTELNSISNYISPLGFAKKYIEEKRENLKEKLKKKHSEMESEYHKIQKENDAWRKSTRMTNFVIKWKSEFPDDPLIADAQRYKSIERLNELENAYNSTPSDTHYLSLMQEIDKLVQAAKNETDKQSWENEKNNLVKKHWDPWLQKELEKISGISTPEGLSREEDNIKTMVSTYGQIEHFTKARNALYTQRKTAEANDWRDTIARANEMLARHDFQEAMFALDRFAGRYPNSTSFKSSTINGNRDVIMFQYLTYLIGKKEKYEDYRNEYDMFVEMSSRYGTKSEYADVANRFLLWSIHNEIKNIMNSDLGVGQKRTAICRLDYRGCTNEQQGYLNELIALANDSLSSDMDTPRWKYLHKWNTPPPDCVEITNRWIWRLNVTQVYVSYSDEAYRRIKGSNDADTYFRIGIIHQGDDTTKYDSKYIIKGPVNTKNYILRCDNIGDIYFNKNDKKFIFEIGDDDTWGDTPKFPSDELGVDDLKGSSKKEFTWKDGTSFTIYYTID